MSRIAEDLDNFLLIEGLFDACPCLRARKRATARAGPSDYVVTRYQVRAGHVGSKQPEQRDKAQCVDVTGNRSQDSIFEFQQIRCGKSWYGRLAIVPVACNPFPAPQPP
jgi:hypothetical protein